ncbi:MAG: carboxypeptidase-like regulatory domain-containing protein [Methanomassiliicoccales archaeon]
MASRLSIPVVCVLLLVASMVFLPSPVAMASDGILVVGTIRDDRGYPLQGVRVTAEAVQGGEPITAFTNASGEYVLSLAVGVYNISAYLPLHSSNKTYTMVSVGQDLFGLDFTLRPFNGTLLGFIFMGQTPLAAATVTLSAGGMSFSANSTAPFGRYEISGVRPGIYVAKAEKQGFWTSFALDPVYIRSGEASWLNFTLLPQPGKVFGVVSLGGSPEAGVRVQLLSQGSLVRESLTDANGNFNFEGIPAGNYTLVFTKEGLRDKSVQISLQPFAELRVDAPMMRRPMQGGDGFIEGMDLTHSMMVVALFLAIFLMFFSLFVQAKGASKPDLLAKEEESEDK